MSAGKLASLSGVRLHYRDVGVGPAVVLLHGWPQTGHEWRRIIPTLSERFRLIIPDIRGFGDSSRPTSGFDIGTLAQDVIELLDQLSVGHFSIIGHDLGGRVAVGVSLLVRERVTRLVLVDTVLPKRAFGWSRSPPSPVRSAKLVGAPGSGNEARYIARFYDHHAERDRILEPADLAEYARCYSRPGSLRCSLELYREWKVSAAFIDAHVGWDGRLSMPVLSVAGAGARGRRKQAERSIEPVVSRLEARLIANCGRLVPEEAPEELCHLIMNFLADVH